MESSLISILAKVSCLVSHTPLIPYCMFPQRMLTPSSKEGKGNKPSPLSVKNTKRKVEGVKKTKADSPVNG